MKSTVLVLSAVCLAASAQAGYVMKSAGKNLLTGETVESRLLIDGRNLRVDVEQGDENAEMIFQGDRQVMLALQPQYKQYVELNREMFAGLARQMNSAMEQMKAQMNSRPPEQRAMLEQMMGSMMPPSREAAPAPEVKVSPNGKTREEHGVTCTGYSVEREGELVSEIYAAPLENVPHADAALVVIKAMGTFLEDLVSEMNHPMIAKMMDNPFESLQRVEGFPMVIVRFKNGEPVEETVMSPPEPEEIDAAQFEAPAGFTKMDPIEGM